MVAVRYMVVDCMHMYIMHLVFNWKYNNEPVYVLCV
jgi:hypothetical protein